MLDTVQRMASALGRTARSIIPGQQSRQMQLRDAYRRFADGADGRLILADLARVCGTGNCLVSGDPFTTHYNLGAYFVLRHIQAQGQISNAQILRAVDEQIAGDQRAALGDE